MKGGDLFRSLTDAVPAEWFLSRLDFFAKTYAEGEVEDAIFGDLGTFQAIDERFHGVGLLVLSSISAKSTQIT